VIKAVLFDVDGVLIDSFESNLQFFRDLLDSAGYQCPTRQALLKVHHLTMKDTIKTFAPEASDEEVEKLWDKGRTREMPYPDHLVVEPTGVEETLKELSESMVLGVVTSRVKEGIYSIPLLAKVENFFQVTVGYQDTENHKPDPEPLLFAARQLKIDPKEMIYIGDMEADLLAGVAAGMKVILYKNELEGADGYASSFEELPELIASLS